MDKTYLVVVKTEEHPDWPVCVRAPREGLAQTRAMLYYPYRLTGALVTYDVVEQPIRMRTA